MNQLKSWNSFIVILLSCCFLSCRMEEQLVQAIPPLDKPEINKTIPLSAICSNSANYIPDPNHLDHFPTKTTMVNFHVIQNDEGKGNFDGATGIHFLYDLIERTNKRLAENKRMHLDTTLPALPIRWRFEIDSLSGIQFHQDEALYAPRFYGRNRDLTDKTVFNKYGTRKDTILNVFVLAHHLDSLKNENYKTSFNGIAFSSWVKCRGWLHSIQDTVWQDDGTFELPDYHFPVGDLIHEVGHVFKLSHTWRYNDGCDDTPKHDNCWAWTSDWKKCSNNIMDYNTWRNAWTPCQIGKLHKAFYMYPKLRNLLKKNWCTYDSSKTIVIDEPIVWNACKDFQGDIRIKKNGKLTIQCAVSMAQNAAIYVEPGGTLILDGAHLYNDCGVQWKGIKVLSRNNKSGSVFYVRKPRLENLEKTIQLVDDSKTAL